MIAPPNLHFCAAEHASSMSFVIAKPSGSHSIFRCRAISSSTPRPTIFSFVLWIPHFAAPNDDTSRQS